ncbi:hypothetical protein F5144DRAFT_633179 [Chaetomium tenue]|uniref:Uncharacterized protein n=1 Tax=Chaetomium tenue TaxID=1854479 RepID=A0ACB7P3R5_9PEZI|nr:hypothetical protein F5144DRAFT_633179 [Chaetomium globosum]
MDHVAVPFVPRRQGPSSPASHPDACPSPASLVPASTPSPAAGDVPQRPTTLPMTIRVDGVQPNRVDPDILGVVYRTTALALGMLSHEHSIKQLVCIGATAIHVWGTRTAKDIIYPTTPCCRGDGCRYMKPSDHEMERWVRFFLDKVRHCSPPHDVRHIDPDSDGEVYGQFDPCNWVHDAEDRCTSAGKELTDENVMLHWDPLGAGVISTQAETVSHVAKLRSQQLAAEGVQDAEAAQRHAVDYRTYLVDGACTLAHELVHCFMRFLAGNVAVFTPRRLMPKGYDDDDFPGMGESGRTWEKLTLGGCVTMGKPRKEGSRPRLWIDQGNREAEVDPDDIRNMVVGKLQFPLKTIGKWYKVHSKRRP